MQDIMLFSSAVMIGLMGSSHCLSMCGGIASAQSFSQGLSKSGNQHSQKTASDEQGLAQASAQTAGNPTDRKSNTPESAENRGNPDIIATIPVNVATPAMIIAQPPGRSVLLPQLLTFNVGRVLSYTFIGFLAGMAGATLAMNSLLFLLLRTGAAVMLILMGLYVGQWWMGLSRIEVIGAKLWQKIAGITNQLRQSKGLMGTFALGMLWGWLPCGLVYSALTWSMSSADPKMAALLMFGFGIGTLPSMLAAGLFAYQLRRIFSKLSVRRIFASILIIFGIWSLPVHWSQWFGGDHGHHAHQVMQSSY